MPQESGNQILVVEPTPALGAGQYTFTLDHSKWQGVEAPHFALTTTASCTILVLTGDANQDGVMTLADVATIRARNREAVGQNNAQCDINHDGAINLIDMAMTRSRLGS